MIINPFIFQNMADFRLNLSSIKTTMPWRDGLMTTSYDGKLRVSGGWNPTEFPVTFSTNQEWESSDNGETFIQLANAPWQERHEAGYGKLANGDYYIWGGDGFSGTTQKDVWKLSSGTWSQVTSDWGLGDRALFAHCIHKNYMYIFGGQNWNFVTPAMYLDVYRSADGITWDLVGNLPAGLNYFSTGSAVSLNGTIYIFGGGRYVDPASDNLNLNVYKSTDDGANWTLVGAAPVELTGIFTTGCAFENKIWGVAGYRSGSNREGIVSSSDGLTWENLYTTPVGTHASSLCLHDSKMFLTQGNYFRECWYISKVNASYPYTVNPLIRNWYDSLVIKPDAALANDLGILAQTLQDAGQWNQIYLMGGLAGLATIEQALKPLITTSKQVFSNNGATFVDYSLKGNGVNQYVNLNWNMVDHLPELINFFVMAMAYLRTNAAEDTVDMGALNNTWQSILGSRWVDGNFYGSVSSADSAVLATADSLGFRGAVLNPSRGLIVNGIETVLAGANVLPTSLSFYGCACNYIGASSNFSTRKQGLFFISHGQLDFTILQNALTTFYTSRGVNV